MVERHNPYQFNPPSRFQNPKRNLNEKTYYYRQQPVAFVMVPNQEYMDKSGTFGQNTRYRNSTGLNSHHGGRAGRNLNSKLTVDELYRSNESEKIRHSNNIRIKSNNDPMSRKSSYFLNR